MKREIGKRYLGDPDRGAGFFGFFGLRDGGRSGRLTRWIGEGFLCVLGGGFDALCFLCTFGVRKDRRLGDCGSGRDHRSIDG